jgi:hypothetical protein
MPLPLYSPGESPQYPPDRRLGGPHFQSRCYEREKNCTAWILAHSMPAVPIGGIEYNLISQNDLVCDESEVLIPVDKFLMWI